jgi:hypothetical protein
MGVHSKRIFFLFVMGQSSLFDRPVIKRKHSPNEHFLNRINYVAISFGLATEVTRIKIWAKDMRGVNKNILGKRIENLQNQLGTN